MLDYTATMHRMVRFYRTTDGMEQAVEARWADAAVASAALKIATAKATAYLPEAAVDLLLELLVAGSTLHADQWAWGIDMDGDVSKPADFERVFGDHRQEAFSSIEERAITALRPLARMV